MKKHLSFYESSPVIIVKRQVLDQMYIYSAVAGHLRLTLYNLVEIIFLEQKGIYLGFFDQHKNC